MSHSHFLEGVFCRSGVNSLIAFSGGGDWMGGGGAAPFGQ